MAQRHMSSTLYKAATAGDVGYLSSSTIQLKVIKVSSDTVSNSKERNERLKSHDLLSLTPEENNCLHIAARFGHEVFLQEVLNLCPSLIYQQNKKGDNPLHVAARAGHLGIVKLLTDSFQPSPQSITGRTIGNSATVGEADEEGNVTTIPNQVENGAAITDSVQPPKPQSQSTGNSAAVGGEIILEMTTLGLGEAGEGRNRGTLLTDFSQPSSNSQGESTSGTVSWRSSENPSLPVWRTQNNDGSTALHEALRSKRQNVALHLMEIPDCEPVVLVINAKDESPLYLAAEAGFDRILTKILEILKAAGHLSNTHVNGVLDERHIAAVGPKGQSPLHAAVFAQSTGCIKLLHNWIPGLIRKPDSYGKTALYYTVQGNTRKILRLLLELDASSAYICDNQGLSPLLVAASIGYPPSVRDILKACPASIESIDNSGYNALHLALKHNIFKVFKRLLKMPEMMTLINQPDQEGNTALHLATMCHKYWHVNALLSTKAVDLTAKNNLGQTALDLCALDWELTARQTQIWRKLRGRKGKASWGRVRPLMRFARAPSIYAAMPRADATDLKQVANTQAVVAALLATVTFAAVLQIPGGYEGSGPNLGSPALIDNPALIVFLLSDTISLCCSIVALYLLLNATRIDTAFLRATVGSSHNLLNRSLITAIIAFISGMYAVISIKSKWVAILVCIFGSSVPFLYAAKLSGARKFTPFVPGLLRRQITRPIIREEVPGE